MSPDFIDVLKFHTLFDLPRGERPTRMAPDALEFRLKFLHEEAREHLDATIEGDLVKATDGLLDFVYVAIGTALFLGAPRAGAKGAWPTFHTTKGWFLTRGLLTPEVPELLPSKHLMLGGTLTQNVTLFEMLHDGGDEISLTLALETLKTMTESAYAIAVLMGVPWPKVWRHVQSANMAKTRAARDGSDSKRGSGFDVVKPVGWVPPDGAIREELIRAGAKI